MAELGIVGLVVFIPPLHAVADLEGIDLEGFRGGSGRRGVGECGGEGRGGRDSEEGERTGGSDMLVDGKMRSTTWQNGDRKSVVSGKSVDLGGHRTIQPTHHDCTMP